MKQWKPHSKYKHLFVVYRIDNLSNGTTDYTTTKAYDDESSAKAEVERMNKVNGDKHCIYDYTIARYVPPDAAK